MNSKIEIQNLSFLESEKQGSFILQVRSTRGLMLHNEF
jgi:hypothetical protein